MFLKSLVLKGFKSFADRSVLSFEPGITAIVGPNGSGKSNVSDSVLWVLGERNAKNLRGQAMEDVIFAGSSARKSVGLAEVDLVLDNSDGTLPVDYAEVAITRRMYRSGESEYLINGAPARRMDVLDILHDSGLGTGTHSIISQGSLDSILQSKPEDRRALIEEAAGVLKHKQRKLRSARKLEQMDAHLARVNDVAAEVARQLGPLERKAKRAQAYQGLSAELAEVSLALAVDDLRVLQGKWEHAAAREREAIARVDELRGGVEAAEKRLESLQGAIRESAANAGELAQRSRRTSSALERIDAAALLLREKERSATARVAELSAEQERAGERAARAEADAHAAREALAEASRAKEQADAQVARLLAEQKGLTEERTALERRAKDEAARERRLAAQIEGATRGLAKAKEEVAAGEAREKLLSERAGDLLSQIAQAKEEIARAQAAVSACEDACAAAEAREKDARARADEARTARDAARSALDAARGAAASAEAEMKGLSEVERAQETSAPALSWLHGNAHALGFSLTPLTHALSAPSELEALVERLLGGDLAGVIVPDGSQACAAAAALAEAGENGEVVLLPEATMRPASAFDGSARDGAEAPASARRLVDELAYSSDQAGLVEGLLGDVWLCERREEALAAHEREARAGGAWRRFVTRDGFAVFPNGKVVAGVPQQGGEGALARRRRIEELERVCVEARERQQRAEGELEQAERALVEANAESIACTQKLAQERGTASSSRAELARAKEKLSALEHSASELSSQREQAHRALEEARPAVDEIAARVSSLSDELDEAKRAAAKAQQEVAPLRSRASALAEEFSEARLAAATSAERETYAQRMVATREQEIARIAERAVEARADLARKRLALSRIAPLLAVFDELAVQARRLMERLEEHSSAAASSSSGLHAAMDEAREASRGAHAAFDVASDALSQVRIEKGRLEVQVEAAVDAIVRDCKTPLETALALPALEDRAQAEDQAFKLRRRIANMGTINPDAAAEYAALKERYDYIAAQLSDLSAARRALTKIVAVIDARMKDDFLRTFEQVNENFQEIFGILFPGGSAELSLVDPDDPENSGVEVTAQPRGKRITKMMLMSGGEKSLTALALLFAVYRIRRAPFYILDEVEAALDDTNLRRLIAYLDSLRQTTQLIMITHQRRTMEMADVLYGISMQADGVTRVVSQRLDHALKYAE